MTPMIHRRDLRKAIGVCGKTLSKYIKTKKLPPPDMQVSARDQWWLPSTLEKAGLHCVENTPAEQPAERTPR